MGRNRRIRHARKLIRRDLEAEVLTLEQAHHYYKAAKDGEWYCPNCQAEGTGDHACPPRGVLVID